MPSRQHHAPTAMNLVLEDEGGIVTEYEYDSVNRLVKTIYANGGTEENEYDKAGNLVSETHRLA